MQRSLIPLVVMLVLCGLCCGTVDSDGDNGDTPSKYAPAILRVLWYVHDMSSLPREDSGATACVSFRVFLENPERHSDISSLQIADPLGAVWTWDSEELAEEWYAVCCRFGLWYNYRPETPYAIALGEYTVTVEEEGKLPVTYSFTVIGRGDTDLNTGLIYSYERSENPKTLKPPHNCSCAIDSQTLIVRFDANDGLIDNGFVWVKYRLDDSTAWVTSGRLADEGALNPEGPNEFELDVSEVPGEVSTAVIVLVAYAPGNRGFYRARSDSIDVERSPVLSSSVRRSRVRVLKPKYPRSQLAEPGRN